MQSEGARRDSEEPFMPKQETYFSNYRLPEGPKGACSLCGNWLVDAELDDDLCEVFLGRVICFCCAEKLEEVWSD
jgi:hypothetical protein